MTRQKDLHAHRLARAMVASMSSFSNHSSSPFPGGRSADRRWAVMVVQVPAVQLEYELPGGGGSILAELP